MNSKIIDVSKWNAILNFSIISDSVDGVIVRVGFSGNNTGVPSLDSRFIPYITELNNNNVPIGAYYVTAAITVEESIKEAQFFINAINQTKIKLSLPIFVCTEWTSSSHNGRCDNISIEDRTNNIKAFIDECTKLGYNCGIMATDTWLDNNLDMTELSDKYIWITSLKDNNINRHNKIMGRISERSEVKGIAGSVCLNELTTLINPYINSPKPEKKSKEKEKKKTYKEGSYFKVKDSEVFKTSISSTVIKTISGRVYVTNPRVLNGRIRITDTKNGETIGWINI